MSTRVLILTASAGNGHNAAAQALMQECERVGAEARLVDAMDRVNPLYRRWFQGGYERLVRKAPKVWGLLYRVSDRKRLCYRYQTVLDYIFCGALSKVLDEFQPDWILCTHSVAQPRLEQFRRTRKFQVAIVITDLHPHLMWLRGAPDRFFVPIDATKLALAERLPMSERRTTVSGIPVNRAFSEARLRRRERHLFVAAGGIGAGPLEQAVEAAITAGFSCSVVTGGNVEAKARLQRRFAGDANVELLGRLPIEKMAEAMASCAAMISKPGGITTFECLASGCPLVIYEPLMIPGQEEDNANWLCEAGAACRAATPSELAGLLASLARNPELLETMASRAHELSRPEAARTILRELA